VVARCATSRPRSRGGVVSQGEVSPAWSRRRRWVWNIIVALLFSNRTIGTFTPSLRERFFEVDVTEDEVAKQIVGAAFRWPTNS